MAFYKNPGYQAFCQFSGKLLRAIQDPTSLAWDLRSKGLIETEVCQQACLDTKTIQQKVSHLLSALEGKIETDERAFDKFLSVLSQNPVLEEIYHDLKECRGTS